MEGSINIETIFLEEKYKDSPQVVLLRKAQDYIFWIQKEGYLKLQFFHPHRLFTVDWSETDGFTAHEAEILLDALHEHLQLP